MLGCLLAIFALGFPRLVLFGIWVFSDYLGRAFETWFWPFMGFLFLPTTTLAYAWAVNEHGGVQGWGLAAVIAGLLLDIRLLSGGGTEFHRHRRRRRRGEQ